jgi:cytoskeletal protein CcmA (bactofilin family)
MRRRRPVLLMGAALLFLCICGALAIGTGVYFGLDHPCNRGGQYTAGADVTIPPGQRTSDVTACGGNVTVLGYVTGDVSAYGGRVIVGGSGRVDGDIKSYGGAVEIAGDVRGDVSSYGGGITLDGTAHVFGDVTSYGGPLTRAPGARVDGDIGNQPAGSGGHGFSFFDPFSFTFPFFPIILGSLLAAALAHWVPQRTLRVGEVMFGALPRCLAIGALSWVLGLILAVILALTIIGIPITLLIGLVLIAGLVMGNVAVGWLIGRALLHRLGSRDLSPVIEAVVGTIILVLLEAIPFFGVLLSVFIAVIGVGATLLSRFGARRWRAFSQRWWAA